MLFHDRDSTVICEVERLAPGWSIELPDRGESFYGLPSFAYAMSLLQQQLVPGPRFIRPSRQPRERRGLL